MNYRLVSKYLGYVSGAISVVMLLPLVWALYFREIEAFWSIVLAAGASGIVASLLSFAGHGAKTTMHQREALALVGISWLLVAVLGSFPYIISGTLGPVDAFFESMSGFTTTGATVLADIEAAPKSILFWRAFSQWLGGIGIVVLFISVLPYLGAGGKQLFKSEAPGPDARSLRPRIRDTAKFLYRVYLSFTAAQIVALLLAGMSLFDAICHTFTTISTAGFSTRQGSIGAYDSVAIELIIVVFMFISGVNFALYFAMLRGKWGAALRDTEFKVYVGIIVVCTVLITANLMGVRGDNEEIVRASQEQGFEGGEDLVHDSPGYSFGQALRSALFQTVSIATTSGFGTDNFDAWPNFSRMLLVVLMFVGACGGSTAGGFKIVRVIMLLKMAYWRLEMSFRPKTIHMVRISGHVVDDDIQRRVSGFFVLYLLILVSGCLFMSALGLPFATATSSVIATMNNIGPALELVGPAMDYHLLPPIAKIYLSFLMIVGRLEIFTIFVLFIPSFWRSKWSH